MPIPDFQSIMLPLLTHIADGDQYKMNDVIEALTEKFNLSEDEKKEMLPSGQSFLFANRAGWARTYLKKAGLIESQTRSFISITKRGSDVLKKKPEKISVKFLKSFPEFVEFHSSKKEENALNIAVEEINNETPEETLENSYLKIRKDLAQEIINKVVSLPPNFFEKLVVELLVKMGYGGSLKDAGKAIGKSGDEGIDGTIKEDKLGLDIIYIQAKRWTPGNIIGRPELHKFVGALAGQGAKKGIFITTSTFTKEAREYIPRNETKIVLIDGETLSQYMIDYNIGVALQQSYEVKKIDNDYFEIE